MTKAILWKKPGGESSRIRFAAGISRKLMLAVGAILAAVLLRAETGLQSEDAVADSGELLPYEAVHALRGVWANLGVSNVFVRTPTPTSMDGVVQVRTEVNLTADAPLRGAFGVSDPASYVDVVQCLPSNALSAVAFSNDLQGAVAAVGCLRDDLPELCKLVDQLKDGLNGVVGGVAAATVPDPGSPLGVGRLFFCGIRGPEGWNALSNAIDHVMDIEPIAPSDGELAAIRLKPGHLYSKLLGGNDPELALVEENGRYHVRCASSAAVRERYAEGRAQGGRLFDNPEFLRCSDGLRDRAGLGFAYVSRDFIPTVVGATSDILNMLRSSLMFDAVWSFSIFELDGERLAVVSQMPRGEENLIESALRCAINATRRWLPQLPELVSFEAEGHLEDTTVVFVNRIMGLANILRQTFCIAGIDYCYRSETAGGREKAGVPETGEEFVSSMFSLQMEPVSEDDVTLLSLIASGAVGENPAERYLPTTAVSAVAFQPDAGMSLSLPVLALQALGHDKAVELIDAAFGSDLDGSDGRSFALAHTVAAGNGEPDVLVVWKIGADLENLKELLDDQWQLEEQGAADNRLLVLRRVSGSEDIQNLRFAFRPKDSMFFMSTSPSLLDQSIEAGVNGVGRLVDGDGFRRAMGNGIAHNTLRYRAGNIFGRSAKRLSGILSGNVPEWLVSQVFGSGLFDLGECGYGVRNGNAFVHYGRAPKRRHDAFRALALAVTRSLGEVLRKSSPYNGETARVFESALTRQDIAAANANGMTTVRVRTATGRSGGETWTFDRKKPLVEDLTMAVDVGKVSEDGGCTYIPCGIALVGICEGPDAGLASIAFERAEATPAFAALMAKGDGGEWSVRLTKGSPSTAKVNVPREAELAIYAAGIRVPSAAFMGWGEGECAPAFSLALNPMETVTIGGEKIPVRPTIGDLSGCGGEVVVAALPFVVGDKTTVTVKAIPGLTYELRRGSTVEAVREDADPAMVANETATNTLVTLTDDKPPADRAFYVIRVTP